MDKIKVIKKSYKLLNNLTPLKTDCGKLCGGECCKGDSDIGMLLFPGEEELLKGADGFNFNKTDDGKNIVVCSSQCDRNLRPLSCRIFPLFPLLVDGRIYLFDDPRAKGICPLLYDEIMIDKKFEKAVIKVGKLLCKNEETKQFLLEVTDEINDILKMQRDIFR